MLRENTFSYNQEDRGLRPITGFSCWALGYLDKEYRRIGCLLHPVQNQGIDLRYRVDYGEKCRRESCPESETFSLLEERAKRFWLHLADGLDSFAYSSRKENPLFHMLGWGAHMLGLIASAEGYGRCRKEGFLEKYPFFQPRDSARAPVYLAKRLIDRENVHLLKNGDFREEFERFSFRLCLELRRKLDAEPTPPPYPPSSSALIAAPPPLPPPPSSTVALLRRTGTKGGEVRERKKSFLPLDGGGKEGVKEIAPPPRTAPNGLAQNAQDSPSSDRPQRKPAVHLLPLERDFLDYLRLFAGVKRIGLEEALLLKSLADEELARFRRSL